MRRALGALLFASVAALANAGCNTSTCSRDPDELFVPLAHNLNLPDAGVDSGEAGAGGESGDGGTDAGAPFDPMQLEGSVTDENYYWSAPFGGPYTYFPPFRTITFEHDLGEAPAEVEFWLAFSPNGTLAPSAGNITELRDGEDAGTEALTPRTITVYNNTCSEFYLRTTASRPAP